MTYGIEVFNSDNVYQINSERSYKQGYVSSSLATGTPGAAISINTDLVFARGTGRFGLNTVGTEWANADSMNAVTYFTLDTLPASGTPAGDWGLQVLDSASDVIFDSRYLNSSSIEIIASGIKSDDTVTEIDCTSALSDLGLSAADLYCCVNSTRLEDNLGPPGGTSAGAKQIRSCYLIDGSTVRIYNYRIDLYYITPSEPDYSTTPVHTMGWMIIALRS